VIATAHIESRMFVCLSRSLWVGWTGLGRATPLGGQAHMRSHRPKTVGRWEPTDHYQNSIQGCVSRLLGQAPTQCLCVLNYPPLLAEGQGVVHASAIVRQKPDSADISSSSWAIPPLDQGVQHRLQGCIATHPAGYGSVRIVDVM
jgi:hypothetical protein